MDYILRPRVQFQILVDLCFLGVVESPDGVLLPALVGSAGAPLEDDWDGLGDYGHNRVDDHRLDEGGADSGVPTGRVVVELPFEDLIEQRDANFLQIGIYQEDQNGRVEELGDEHAVGNLGDLFRVGVIADSGDQLD